MNYKTIKQQIFNNATNHIYLKNNENRNMDIILDEIITNYLFNIDIETALSIAKDNIEFLYCNNQPANTAIDIILSNLSHKLIEDLKPILIRLNDVQKNIKNEKDKVKEINELQLQNVFFLNLPDNVIKVDFVSKKVV